MSFTAGPDGTLLTPQAGAGRVGACARAGAKATLVNCIAAELTLPYVQALAGPAHRRVRERGEVEWAEVLARALRALCR